MVQAVNYDLLLYAVDLGLIFQHKAKKIQICVWFYMLKKIRVGRQDFLKPFLLLFFFCKVNI